MKDIYIFNSGRLRRKDSTIYFEQQEGNKKALAINSTECIHLFGEIDLNTSFLELINKHNIFLHVYNYYGFYNGSFVPRKKNISGNIDVKQVLKQQNLEERLRIAKSFIHSAEHHMRKNLRQHKEKTEEYIKKIEKEVKGIENCKNIQQLMGVEGQIRKLYYESFNSIINNKDFHMQDRNKRPPTDPINALISFGNTLMYTTVLSEMYKTQINPTISFLHEPSTRRYSLSLDIAEIFKPLIIDSLIFSLINKKMIKKEHFEYIEEKICYLNENGKKIFIKEYNKKLEDTIKHRTLNRNVSYRYLIRLENYKLIKDFIGEKKYKPLKAWW